MKSCRAFRREERLLIHVNAFCGHDDNLQLEDDSVFTITSITYTPQSPSTNHRPKAKSTSHPATYAITAEPNHEPSVETTTAGPKGRNYPNSGTCK